MANLRTITKHFATAKEWCALKRRSTTGWFFSCYSWLRDGICGQLGYFFLLAAGPLFLGWSKFAPTAAELAAGKEAWPFTRWWAGVFNDHPNVALACYFTPLVGVPLKLIGAWLDRKAAQRKSVSGSGLLQLLSIFLNVVGHKMESTGERAEKALSENPDLETKVASALVSNTRYDQVIQIRELVQGIYNIFRHTTGEQELKVTLAYIQRNTIERFVYFLPKDQGPTTSLDRLRHKCSTFSVSSSEKRMVIIESLRKEHAKGGKKPDKRRFVSDDVRDGALLCSPVWHRNLARVMFAISVYSEKSGTLREIERTKYELILKQFEKRLLVEYNLLVLEVGRLTEESK